MYITPISYVGHIRSMSYDPIKKQSSSGSLALGSLALTGAHLSLMSCHPALIPSLMGQTSPMLASGSALMSSHPALMGQTSPMLASGSGSASGESAGMVLSSLSEALAMSESRLKELSWPSLTRIAAAVYSICTGCVTAAATGRCHCCCCCCHCCQCPATGASISSSYLGSKNKNKK